MSNRGKLFVISGPSGSGKGTLLKRIFEDNDRLKYSISATTRPMRAGEINEKDYFFMDYKDFKKLIDENGLLEWAEYCRNCYGTPKKPVETWMNEGFDVILEIDVDGAIQVQRKREDAIMVFIKPPTLNVLEQRLRERGSEDESDINLRLSKAKNEIDLAGRYDYVIINDDLEKAVKELGELIKEKGGRN